MEKKRIYFTSDPEEIRKHLEKLYAKISNRIKLEDSVNKKKEKLFLIKRIITQMIKLPFQLLNFKH